MGKSADCGHRPHFARSRCKPCYNKWYYESRDEREYQRQYYLRNRARRFANVYGITLDEYDALLLAQGGRCAICHRAPSGADKWGQLAVDHIDTEDGPAVRGLLCLKCNSLLGMADDSEGILKSAIFYLAAFQSKPGVG